MIGWIGPRWVRFCRGDSNSGVECASILVNYARGDVRRLEIRLALLLIAGDRFEVMPSHQPLQRLMRYEGRDSSASLS